MLRVTIQGITLYTGPAYEAVAIAESFLEENMLHVIGTITAKTMAAARRDETVKRHLEQMDLAVFGETGMLRAADADTPSLLQEVKSQLFFHTFLESLEKNNRNLYLLSDDREKLERLKAWLDEAFPQLQRIGEYVLEEQVGEADLIVNEINGAAPDLVLSVIDSPAAEHFFTEQSRKLGIRLWYEIGDFEKMYKKIHQSPSFFRRFALK
ncbi:MAG: WecB/TagA/CpsF family glycosyltransferase [Lachnospiraceae bacterium]|nr:WecB/TagA/CpsF family glycosyltransferase [Lachnospiraceae bacterium]